MAAAQERTIQANQQHILSRANIGNQPLRSGTSLPPVSQMPSTGSHSHTLPNQTGSQNVGLTSFNQENTGLHVQQNQQQQSTMGQSEEQMHVSSNYGTPLPHFGTNQKPYSGGMSLSMEEKEFQRKMDEIKRKQAEFEENQKKQVEELRQHQLQQQEYQQNQHLRNQQPLHHGMLRLKNFIINESNTYNHA